MDYLERIYGPVIDWVWDWWLALMEYWEKRDV